MQAIGAVHPAKSSFSKLVKALGTTSRNEISEVVSGLKAVGYLNVTTVNEIYLLADGRKYLGIDIDGTGIPETLGINDKVASNSKATQQEKHAIATDVIEKKEPDVLNSIAALGERLARPTININNIEIKTQALNELSKYLAEDIADLLLEVKADLERLSA